ncbi:MAG: DUF1616 domain-containing protein, partial [Candidatus Thermoplasmatota archaeon]|nr:DUF1616 domain-containing protein [Candidatus Thermoplasmatota archaeon]
MKIDYPYQPIDIIILLLISILLVPIILFDINQTIRIMFGLPFILFIPGYLLIYTLFPKQNKEIDFIERIALSFGLSIAIVPLIGLGLNYTPFGITLSSVLSANLIFILSMAALSYVRGLQTPIRQRINYTIDLRFPSSA